MFTASGAIVTANYSYNTVSKSTTLNSGIYNIAGTLTVQAGVTLTLNQGAILNFPSGASLVVNGALVTNGATLTSPNGTNWNGIALTSANGSRISNTTISYALSPIIINSTSSIIVSGCTINHSSFYNNNSSVAAAIQVSLFSPTISTTTINGQSNSWNGVRFYNGSSGSLNSCTIENLGNGNGVIIQGNSSPVIFDNTIQNNYFHGITVYYNSSASPRIQANSISNNSITNYVGIYFQSSVGLVQSNLVSGFTFGIWCRYASSPNAGSSGQEGSNNISNNIDGIVATDNSYPNFGYTNGRYYFGVCNQIYGNITYDAVSETGSNLYAAYNWWGQYPINPSKFYVDGTSYLGNSNAETSSTSCPIGGGSVIAANPTPILSSAASSTGGVAAPRDTDYTSLILQASEDRLEGNFVNSSLLCRKLLYDNNASLYHKKALVMLFNIFETSKDSSVVSDLLKFSELNNHLSLTAKQLLANVYLGFGKLAVADSMAKDIIKSNPNSEAEKQALFLLSSLSGYSSTYNATSSSALNMLIKNYSSSIDSGLIAALTVPNSSSLPGNSSESLAGKKVAEKDKVNLTFQLDNNYPNPFNPTTVINYQIPKDGYVSLKVYDALGREVKTIVNEYKSQGKYSVNFDAGNLSSGVYFYQLKTGNYTSIKKMILLK